MVQSGCTWLYWDWQVISVVSTILEIRSEIRLRAELEVRSWSWKWGWGANRKENKTQKEEQRGQRIDIPWCCELGTAASCGVISVDVSAVTRFDLLGISASAGLHDAPVTSLHRLKIGNADDTVPTVVADLPRCAGGLNDTRTGCLVYCVGCPAFDRRPN